MGEFNDQESHLGSGGWQVGDRYADALGWDGARKRVVLFEKAAADELLRAIPKKHKWVRLRLFTTSTLHRKLALPLVGEGDR